MHAVLFQLVRHRLLRQLVACVLVCALPMNSMSSVLLNVLGPQHRHSTPAHGGGIDAGVGLDVHSIIRAVVGEEAMGLIDAHHAREQVSLAAPPHAMTEQEHAHAHSLFQRHHHNPSDGTVIALGERETGQGAANGFNGIDAGSAFPLPAVVPSLSVAPAATGSVWRGQAITAWHDHVSAPLEKPPRG